MSRVIFHTVLKFQKKNINNEHLTLERSWANRISRAPSVRLSPLVSASRGLPKPHKIIVQNSSLATTTKAISSQFSFDYKYCANVRVFRVIHGDIKLYRIG